MRSERERAIRNATRYARRVEKGSGERVGKRRTFDERHRGIEDDLQRLAEAVLFLASVLEEGSDE